MDDLGDASSHFREVVQAAFGEEQFEGLYEAGKSMTVAQAVELAKEIVS